MKKFYFLLLGLFLFSGVNAQTINIPDANFKARLLAANTSNGIAKNSFQNSIKIDTNSNGEIEVSEISNVYELNLESSFFSNYSSFKISSLDGISNFTSLIKLDCSQNLLTNINLSNLQSLICSYNQLTSLDLSNLTNLNTLEFTSNQIININLSGLSQLSTLKCSANQLTNLNLNGLNNLYKLECYSNQLSNLDLSNFSNLTYLECYNNQLTSISVNGLANLYLFDCHNNQLTSLNVNGCINLVHFFCNNNQLTNLDLSGLMDLWQFSCNHNQLATILINGIYSDFNHFDCSFNQLTSLNVSSLNYLQSLNSSDNQLISLFLKNARNESLNFSNNPNLQYICADEGQLSQIQNTVTSLGYLNCVVNSYCSFTPGGTFYTIQGNNRFDNNNNGCDVSDDMFPNLKFNITNGTINGSTISITSGNYSIPVQTGTHTVTPVFENPTYFNVSPSTVNVTFPTQASPFTQNFCVTANGIHPDLEVTLLPLTPASPGFDATYKIIYKNKGNTTQSGSVNLTFNDVVLDLVAVNPVTSSQATNYLSWNFTTLLPFETREIALTLNVNSPTETPAVDSGDLLNYTTTITSPATDDLPSDNTFVYNQTVVNSFDPNDKTCLEGATITPAKVGDYVHYMIRFENNGTANAQNIVVKDMIDTAKFDINTLIPIKGSHLFVTNITSGIKVEFIFQNINLPFDNANNDGYVAFKIKTKSTLILGDTFTNNASIYFDYNFPIVTNTATTTIAVLAMQDFVFSNYFSVYPNPVEDILNITAKETIEVTSVNIYNTLGQLVLVIPNAQNTSSVDVSGLTTGNYFIKINSDKGTSNTKFIKN